MTGASSGIGAACVRTLAGAGYRVALLARRTERLEHLAAELGGVELHPVVSCDLADGDSIAPAVEAAASALGGLDLVVNNAGLGYRALVCDLEPEPLQRLLAVNVAAVLLVCRAAHPHLAAGREPVLVNVASVLGRRGFPTQAAYAASKAAVVSIGESLRLEWAPEGIEICTLAPGLTRTGILEAQENPAGLADPDLSGAMDPEQVAQAILELDRSPQPERFLSRSWRWMGVLSPLVPRWADAVLRRKLGGSSG